MRRLRGCLLLVVSLTICLIPTGALSQSPTPTQTQDRKLEVRLNDISMWVGPADTLAAVISVRNRGTEVLRDLQVAVAIYQGIATRSHLERSFDGRLGQPVFSDTIPVEGTVEPGSSTTITVVKPLSEVGFFKTADDRVYPVSLTVKSGRVSAPSIQTHMIFFTKVAPVPLSVAMVFAPSPDPIYTPAGLVTEAGVSRLVGEASGLESMVSALETRPEAHLTLAPSGLLIESLADLSNGYILATSGTRSRRVDASGEAAVRALHLIERLRAISTHDTVRFATNTYSYTSLPWLRNEGFGDRIAGQLDQTRRALNGTLGVQTTPGWVIPGDGIVDDATAGELAREEFSALLLAPESVRGQDKRLLTLAAPLRVGGRQSATNALVYDRKLSSRVTPTQAVGAVETRQRFLAETATVMLERPAQKRVIAVVPPRDWIPHPKFLGDVLIALAGAPWMRGVRLDQSLTAATINENVSALSTEAVLDRLPSQPAEEYLRGLRSAANAISDYTDLRPPEPRVARLLRKLAIAESSVWWDNRRDLARGLDFAESVASDVRREFSKIRGPRPQTITFTSRTGTIPLVVTNSADYPVQVVVRLESDNLEFSSGNVIEQELSPPAQTFDITARTTSSGTFPLRVVVETPDGSIEVDATNLIVRSTAYNLVGVAITIGAALFLVAWWGIGAARRRIAT